jgi:hypothetical protein
MIASDFPRWVWASLVFPSMAIAWSKLWMAWEWFPIIAWRCLADPDVVIVGSSFIASS